MKAIFSIGLVLSALLGAEVFLGHRAEAQGGTQNILNNGDFELALAGFGMWQEPTFGPYKILLSDDSFSGDYAIEFRCTTGDCRPDLGYIIWFFSDFVDSEATEYEVSFYAKTEGGGRMLATIEGGLFTTITDTTPPGTWTQYTKTFQGQAGQKFRVLIYYSGNGSLFVDNLILEKTDGTTPVVDITVPNTGKTSFFSLDENENLFLNEDGGETPVFPVGFFVRDTSLLSEIADMGANCVVVPPIKSINNPGVDKSPMDLAWDEGLYSLPELSEFFRIEGVRALPALVPELKKHRGLMGYYLTDEAEHPFPTIHVEPDVVAEGNSFVKEIDPQNPTWTLLQGWNASIYASYMAGTDIIGSDPYPTLWDASPSVMPIADYVEYAHSAGGNPVWMVLESYDPRTDPDEMNAMFYLALAHDTKGILWFSYEALISAALPELKLKIEELIGEATAINEPLHGPTMTNIDSSNDQIHFITKSHGTDYYLISVNPTESAQTTTFDGAALGAVSEVEVLFESRMIPVSGDQFQDAFGIYERHVYKFEVEPGFLPPVADFSASPVIGDAPLTVTFTDDSSDGITSWLWDFGDGESSTDQNPTHTYAIPGSFTVTLTVTKPTGSDSEEKANYVQIGVVETPAHGRYQLMALVACFILLACENIRRQRGKGCEPRN